MIMETYGRGLSSMNRHDKNARKLTAAWQMNTTRSESAYESTAAFCNDGSRRRMYSVECLRMDTYQPRPDSERFRIIC